MIKELLEERNLPEIPKDKNEIKEILQREIYGYMPSKPESVSFEKISAIEERFPCGASLNQMKCLFTYKGKTGEFLFKTALHSDGEKHPVFIHINFRADTPDLYQPTEEILDGGFDVISVNYKDVTSDDTDFTTGIAPIFVVPGERTGSTTGKINIWSWAASRLIDYALTLPATDTENIAVVGHSRLGKTALVTGMHDERVKYTISNDSGCAGAAIARKNTGETVEAISRVFPHWFCPNYRKYADNEEQMPFDQHFLLASTAPRYVYIASASLDSWACPVNEYLSCHAVSEYFKEHGTAGFIAKDALPEENEYFHDGSVGYHLRPGAHFLSRYDWNMYMKFIKGKMKK